MSVDFNDLEQQNGLPPGLLAAVQQQESGGDPDAVSPKGAVGAFQFLPSTAKQYGIDPTDPDQAAHGAARMFGDLSKKYNGDVPSMLAAYNWGQGNLDRKGMGKAPEETRNYIQSIQSKLSRSLPQGTQYAAADTGNMTDATVDALPDPSKMTEAEVDAELAKLQGGQRDPSSMSEAEVDAELAKLQGGKQQPEYSTDPVRTAYQATMNTVAKPINNAVSSVMGAATSPISYAAHPLAGAIDSTGAGQWIGDKLMAGTNAISDAIAPAVATLKDYESLNPDLAKDLSAFGQNVQLAGNIAPLAGASKLAGKMGDSAADALMQPEGEFPSPNFPKVPQPDIPNLNILPDAMKGTRFASQPNYLQAGLDGNKAISEQYAADKAVMKTISDKLSDEGGKFTLQMPEIYDKLNKTIAALEGRVAPGSQEEGSLSALRDIRDNLTEKYSTPQYDPAYLGVQSETPPPIGITPNDLVQIRKSINSGLNINKFLTAGKGQLLDLKNTVQDGLATASEQSPEFGRQLENFNNQAAQLGKYETKSMAKLWQPEDYVKHVSGQPLTSDGVNRASNFLNNLNSKGAGTVDALTDVLPSNQSTNILRTAQIHARGKLPSLTSSAKELIAGHPLRAVYQAGNALLNPQETNLQMLAKQMKPYKKGGAINTSPTEAQIKAGNYAKGHITLHGLNIAIENPKGSIRRDEDRNGKSWRVKMPADYGYIKRTEGADGDHVDCYVGDRPKSEKVWILDQKDHDTGKFDEHKIFLGFPNKALALATYRKAFSDGKADKRIHAITECTIDELKHWLKTTMRKAA